MFFYLTSFSKNSPTFLTSPGSCLGLRVTSFHLFISSAQLPSSSSVHSFCTSPDPDSRGSSSSSSSVHGRKTEPYVSCHPRGQQLMSEKSVTKICPSTTYCTGLKNYKAPTRLFCRARTKWNAFFSIFYMNQWNFFQRDCETSTDRGQCKAFRWYYTVHQFSFKRKHGNNIVGNLSLWQNQSALIKSPSEVLFPPDSCLVRLGCLLAIFLAASMLCSVLMLFTSQLFSPVSVSITCNETMSY